MQKIGLLVVAATLFGCNVSDNSLRGISPRSTCSDVVASEQQAGATLIGRRPESGASGPVEVHEMSGDVDGVPVRIEVACDRADLYMVVFEARVSSDSAASEAFDRLKASVAREFPTAQVAGGKHGRTAKFECIPAGLSIVLIEDLLSRGALRPSATLLVVPRPGVC